MSYEQFELSPVYDSKQGTFSLDLGKLDLQRKMSPIFKADIGDVHFRLVGERGILQDAPTNGKIVKLRDLTLNEKKVLIQHLNENKSKAPNIGAQWSFIREPDSNALYAYGGNLEPKNGDISTIQQSRDSLLNLINNEVKTPPSKITPDLIKKIAMGGAASAVALLLIIAGIIVYQRIMDDVIAPPDGLPPKTFGEAVTGVPPRPPEEKKSNNEPFWNFYEATFPTVYGWLNDKQGMEQRKKELADKIIRYEHIESLWVHTHKPFWQRPDDASDPVAIEKQRARAILYDFFNNNKTIKAIWKDDKNRSLLRKENTEFAKLIEVYSTYAWKYRNKKSATDYKVFYWQADDIGLKKTDISKLFKQYHIGKTDWHKTFDYNKDFRKGSFADIPSLPVKVVEEGGPSQDWFVAVYVSFLPTLPDMKDTKQITLFKSGQYSLIEAYNKDLVVDGEKRTLPDKTQEYIEWYRVPAETAEKLKFLGVADELQRTFTDRNRLEKDVVFKNTEQYIRSNYFISISAEELEITDEPVLIMSDKDNEGYGFSTTDPLTGYVLLNAFREETIRDAKQQNVEREENNILESHIMLRKDVPFGKSDHAPDIKLPILEALKNQEKFVAAKDGKEYVFHRYDTVKFFKPYMYRVETSTLGLNTCIDGAKINSPEGTFYLYVDENGNCQRSYNDPNP